MWQEQDESIVKEFNFPDFKTALAFVNRVGELAEGANHHPDINLGWGRVVIALSTHEAAGVTEKDRQLAKEIDKVEKG